MWVIFPIFIIKKVNVIARRKTELKHDENAIQHCS